MKRILLIISVLFMVTTIKAQFYVGGSVGLGFVKQHGDETKTTFKIIPEVGYNINDNWAVGLAFGFKKGSCLIGKGYYNQNAKSKAIGIQPYVRYIPFHISIIDIFVDGCFTYEKIIDEGENINIGLRPGLSIKPIKNLSIVTHIGFLGAEIYNPKDGGSKDGTAGLDLDASDLTLGLFYNF